MLKQVLRRYNYLFYTIFILGVGVSFASFIVTPDEQKWITWGNKCLTYAYDPAAEVKLKKWELTLTSDAFVRFRKTYTNGKQEYYSFQLHRFKDMDYLGNVNEGVLKLKANADDIIVQTYDDPKGNVDSMATTLSIPVKNMDPDRLDSLRKALIYFKERR
ncbi:hypothetical protein [Mucilaginibacter ginkgonis]|uniref:Uncharacterized protein n=1 Tax=Mucilaginibacter ginkgonis TaxID=2682091 RepID=A0A6I4HYR4_9SPHI|nr:hypothetical protein [Mucilaginibacter ginkgonis]QQL49648.1 hypothetical protein GO620_015980 [Mucilaginibacter ginkgonis]